MSNSELFIGSLENGEHFKTSGNPGKTSVRTVDRGYRD